MLSNRRIPEFTCRYFALSAKMREKEMEKKHEDV